MKIFKKQHFQLAAGAALAAAALFAVGKGTLTGSWAGWSARRWFRLALAVPVFHQLYVVVCWRGELYYGWLSDWFGGKALTVFGAGFLLLLISRLVTVLGTALADRFSLAIPSLLRWSLVLVCLGLSGYLGYSVIRYFSFPRALGIDHFHPDNYREKPFVRAGIFRFSANAMYLFGFLILYVPGLILGSRAGLLTALFNHLYIWAHYFFTEKPDLEVIYGSSPTRAGSAGR